MSTGRRGGRGASLPTSGWEPPAQGVSGPERTVVVFRPEDGSAARGFDFSRFGLSLVMRQWLARAFAAHVCGSRSPVKRVSTARNYYAILKLFAESLGQLRRPPTAPGEVTAAHIRAFLMPYAATTSQQEYRKQMRTVLGNDDQLPLSARQALIRDRGCRVEPKQLAPYTDGEWQRIMVILRHEVSTARHRIHASRGLLAAYRAGEPIMDFWEVVRAQVLDEFDRTASLPRMPSGDVVSRVQRVGGIRGVGEQLCLTNTEAVGFCLLLTMLMGQNFGTVARWPAIVHCPDGGSGTRRVALIEATKPRRGPEHEHMVTALEDVPAELADVLSNHDDDRPLFLSPLRVYLLLLDLTELARRHGGHNSAFASFTCAGNVGTYWPAGLGEQPMRKWCRNHRQELSGGNEPGLSIHVSRIRQTVIERRRQPIANSFATARDEYLLPSQTVAADSRIVVAAALREQVDKARAHQAAQIIAAHVIDTAAHDLPLAAASAGLEPVVLQGIIDGTHDTVAAACVDHRNVPAQDPDTVCRASFLACLSCANARALPRHLPVQIVLKDRMEALRPHMVSRLWAARFGQPLGQLREIIGHYTLAEQNQARAAVTGEQKTMVDDLLAGKLDLR